VADARVFPHKLPCSDNPLGPAEGGGAGSSELYSELRISPFLDDLAFDLAEDAVDKYELGRDGSPDLLALSLSATDFIGHRYGPDSQEVLDQLRRLDRRLGIFLDRLDRKVGLARTLVVLTGDHGVTSCPERDPAHRAQRVNKGQLRRRLEAALISRLGPGGWVEGLEADQVYLAHDSPRVEQAAAEALEKEPSVERVYRSGELEAGARPSQGPAGDAYLPLMRASWLKGRGGDLMIRVHEGWMITESPFGSEHGTPYPADMHVPLIFRGPGIGAGSRPEPVSVYRVAPSIAQLLGFPYPPDLPEGPLPMAP
jgi:arylsulfatase A-like enzyme